MISFDSIAGQHGNSVALLFLKYGIDLPVTSESLQYALAQHGEPFATELSNAVANDFRVFTGYGGKRSLVKNDKHKQYLVGYLESFLGIGKKKKARKAAEQLRQLQANQQQPQIEPEPLPEPVLSPAQRRLDSSEIKTLVKTPLTEDLRKQVEKELSTPVEPEKKVIQQEVKNTLQQNAKTPGIIGGIIDKVAGAIDDVRDIVAGEDDKEVYNMQQQAKSVWPSIIGFGVVIIVVAILYYIGKDKK